MKLSLKIGKNTNSIKLITMILTLAFVFILAIFLGRYDMKFMDVIKVIYSNIFLGGSVDKSLEITNHIIWEVRIPRILVAGLVGASLSIAGASMQGLFQNSLVSPDTLGVCSGAGFGAALGILLTSGNGILIYILSFAFGVLSMVIVFLLSKAKKENAVLSMVLSGIIVSSVFMSLISLTKYVADTDEKLFIK